MQLRTAGHFMKIPGLTKYMYVHSYIQLLEVAYYVISFIFCTLICTNLPFSSYVRLIYGTFPMQYFYASQLGHILFYSAIRLFITVVPCCHIKSQIATFVVFDEIFISHHLPLVIFTAVIL